eukprot:COSAG01_NODE_46217_length_402_cov_0.627063_1_plen_89_part_01
MLFLIVTPDTFPDVWKEQMCLPLGSGRTLWLHPPPPGDANVIFKLHACHCTRVGKAVGPYFQAVFGMPNQVVVVRDIALDVAAITLWAK